MYANGTLENFNYERFFTIGRFNCILSNLETDILPQKYIHVQMKMPRPPGEAS